MIKFETINGTLCRMVEPTPLTEKSLTHYTPCVIRPIKDNTQIGKLNKRTIYDGLRNCNGVYILNERQIGTGSNKNMIHTPWGSGHNFEQFEIIGYPVAEGSRWWALYQMMNGEKICHHKAPSIMYCKRASKIMREVRCGCVDYMSIDAWLNGADKNGWQIYKEPEPQYKVGDWVEWHEGLGTTYQSQITRISHSAVYSKGLCIPLKIITRKLKPSEVVVKIGCLSGTVRLVSTNGIYMWFHLIDVDDKIIATIRIGCLDKETRKLVESLLKAQEEES